jgi:GntR family transcriptional regulator, transcriptional repressor for pyruvate dehydrogenase complex
MEQAHQPRLADVVAERLRADILSGKYKEGEVLDVHAGLVGDFGVSMPALREGIRILENDGLLRTRRGNRGGVVVQLPTPRRIGEVIAMVLQARKVDASDISRVLGRMEPACATMCAERPDRAEVLVPGLREIVARQWAQVDDLDAYMPNARAFHDAIVAGCGSETMVVALGALEAIWSSHAASRFADRVVQASEHADRRAAVQAHEAIADAIAGGDGEAAAALLRGHITDVDTYYPEPGVPQRVDAALIPRWT